MVTPSTPHKAPPLGAAAPPRDAALLECHRMRIAGALNFIGDVSLLADGIRNKDWMRATAGGLYTAGASAAMLFGSCDRDTQLQALTERTASFLHAHASHTPASLKSSQVLEARDNGVVADAQRFLQQRSAEVMLWFYTLGAGAMLASGIRDARAGKGKLGGLLVGATSLGVKAGSALMPESHASTSEQATPEPSNPIAWLCEKPMRLFGYGSLATEAFWAWDTWESFKSGKDWKLGALTTLCYGLSDVVAAGAHKDTANALQLSNTELTALVDMAAETILAQPPSQQREFNAKLMQFFDEEPALAPSRHTIRLHLQSMLENHARAEPPRQRSEQAADLQSAILNAQNTSSAMAAGM